MLVKTNEENVMLFVTETPAEEIKVGREILHEPSNIKINRPIPNEDLEYIARLYFENKLVCHETHHFETREPIGLSKLNKLGNGSYGRVYEYKNYAIKYYNERAIEHEENQDAEILKKIDDLEFIPNLYAEIDDRVIIVDKITGTTLYDYYKESEINTYNLTEKSIDELCSMLTAIIRRGYTPRDVHENNVMITPEGRLIIVDVGLFYNHGEQELTPEEIEDNSGYRTALSWSGRTIEYCLEKFKQNENNENIYIAV